MMLKNILYAILLSLPFVSNGQVERGSFECAKARIAQYQDFANSNARIAFPGDPNIDVNYYGLDLEITTNPTMVMGAATIKFTPIANGVSSYQLDLHSNFLIDSVMLNGSEVNFTHQNNRITIPANTGAEALKSQFATIYYRGVPPTGVIEEGIFFENQPNSNNPVVYTLSEPYGAISWFPCNDNPEDKADSCDVNITMDNFFIPVSNGKFLGAEDVGKNRKKHKWSHKYPISHYLISIAATNYTFKQTTWSYGDSINMDVVDYLYQRSASNPTVIEELKRTNQMLDIFSNHFGVYPFYKEKYGHAMFNFGGGMEHQTISSMGGFNETLIAHELAHQWYGNKVTCKTWQDIWVNEGFATYLEAIYLEDTYGKSRYNADMDQNMGLAKQAKGTIFVQNTNSINEIFNFQRTYAKGAVVLHMLRGVMGDEIFFKFMKEYANGEFSFGAASIDDVKKVAQQVSGLDLTDFFEQWLFKDGYPSYDISYSIANKSAAISINQKTVNGSTPLFKMPMQIEVVFQDGSSEIQRILIDQKESQISLENLTKNIKEINFDPFNYIMKEMSVKASVAGVLANENGKNSSLTIYPNPSQEYITVSNSDLTNAYLSNSSGQRVSVPIFGEKLDIRQLPAAKYYIHLVEGDHTFIQSFIKL
jgi:aminopeptidase N